MRRRECQEGGATRATSDKEGKIEKDTKGAVMSREPPRDYESTVQ